MGSKISKLKGKSDEFIGMDDEGKEVRLALHPMKNKELLEIIELAEKKQTGAMINKVLFYTLRKDDIELEESEIENMPASYSMDMFQTALKVNGLEKFMDFQKGEDKASSPPKVLGSQSKAEFEEKIKGIQAAAKTHT